MAFPRAGRAAPQDFTRAAPSVNSSGQLCQLLENLFPPSSFPFNNTFIPLLICNDLSMFWLSMAIRFTMAKIYNQREKGLSVLDKHACTGKQPRWRMLGSNVSIQLSLMTTTSLGIYGRKVREGFQKYVKVFIVRGAFT